MRRVHLYLAADFREEPRALDGLFGVTDEPKAPSRARAILGFLAAGATVATLLRHGGGGDDVVAAIAVAAAFCSRGGPLLLQVSARAFFAVLTGAAALSAIVTPDPIVIAMAAASLVALVAPGMAPLESASAQREFHPVAERTAFLVSAIAALAAAAPLLLTGVDLLRAHHGAIVGGAAIGLGLLATGGVWAMLRMRALGFIAIATAGATAAMLALALATEWGSARLGAYREAWLSVPFVLAAGSLSSVWIALVWARRHAPRQLRVERIAALPSRLEPLAATDEEVLRKTYA